MKDLVKKEYLRRVKLVATSKLYAGNLCGECMGGECGAVYSWSFGLD